MSVKSDIYDALSAHTAGRCYLGDARPAVSLPYTTFEVAYDNFDSDGNTMASGYEPGQRELLITVEAHTLLQDGSEWPLDDISYHIERIFASATTLNTTVSALRLDTTSYEIDETDDRYGKAVLSYIGFVRRT